MTVGMRGSFSGREAIENASSVVERMDDKWRQYVNHQVTPEE